MKKVVEFIIELKNKGVFFQEANNQLKVIGEISSLTDFDKEKIKGFKEQIIELLKSRKTGQDDFDTIKKAGPAEYFPLSSAQYRLWVLNQFEGANLAYNLPGVFVFTGNLNINALEKAILNLIDRHEILRTVFKENADGDVKQFIKPLTEFKCSIGFNDLSNNENMPAVLKKNILIDFEHIFELDKGPLIKASLFQVEEKKWVFTFVMHHIISDGWSIGVLMRELFQTYNSLSNGKEPLLEPLKIQYKDYSLWQQKQLNSESLNAQKEYWLQVLQGELPVLQMPSDNIRPSIKTYNGGNIKKLFNSEITGKLKEISAENGGTLFMGLLTALNILIYKFSGQNDIIVGSPIAGRTHVDLESQIGIYINTIALRNKFNSTDSFIKLFENVKEATLNAYKNQLYPFDELVEDLKIKRDMSRSPVFDIMLILQNSVDNTTMFDLNDVKISPYEENIRNTSKLDLTFTFEEKDNQLYLELEYNCDIFSHANVLRIVEHFEKTIESVIVQPNTSISKLNIINESERNKLLYEFNKVTIDSEGPTTIVNLFQEQTKRTPDNIAVIMDNEQLTYKELNEFSNQLASYLRKKNVTKDTLVPICIERGINMLVGLLGIIKAGGAYVPIDPEYPSGRISYMLENSAAKIILTDSICRSKLSLPKDTDVIEVDLEWAEICKEDKNDPDHLPLPSSLAYVIFTSGSTGAPKGVMIEHFSLLNFIRGIDEKIPLKNSDNLLAITSVSFDISILELFYPICKGATVTIKKQPNSLNNFDSYLENNSTQLDFSLFYFSSKEENSKNKYDLLLRSVDYADKNDFSAVWLPERHFHEFGGIFPNPSVLCAALSTITKKIELRSGSIVLPLQDVVRVAEEWSVVDNLSNGRVSLSIASGWHADDFVLKPENYINRQEIMYDQIEELKSLWKGESIRRKNGMNNEIDIKIFPRPVQPQIPIWITSAGNPETFIRAGKIGARILTHLLGQEIKDLENNIKLYHNSLKENGFSPEQGRVALMLHTHIGNDLDQVKADVKEPFKSYLRSSINLIKNLAKDVDINPETLNENDINSLLEIGFERYWQTSALLGTKESCAALLKKLHIIGITEVACLIDFGMEDNKVISGLNYLNELRKQYNKPISSQKPKPITTLQITPSYINTLLEDELSREFLNSLTTIIIGGERLFDDVYNKLTERLKAGIYNMYGPTETTIWSTAKKLVPSENVTIGKPLRNTKIYILDKDKNLCPIGVNGDLYIGGDGLARGYLNAPELTTERFINNPFDLNNQNLIYKTGDVAKWLLNGEIEFIGRNDQQVKINGYRIELGEIENTLVQFNFIKDAAVVKKENLNKENFLVAYFVSTQQVDIKIIKTYLTEKLPKHMIPAFIIELDNMPLTANGKTDKKALMLLNDSVLPNTHEYVAPANKTEEILLEIWTDVLGIKKEKIGMKDSFFDLGGNSLKMIKAMNLINKKLNQKLSLVNAYGLPSIYDLSQYITSNTEIVVAEEDADIDQLFNRMQTTFNLVNNTENE